MTIISSQIPNGRESLHIQRLGKEDYVEARTLLALWKMKAEEKKDYFADQREQFRDWSCDADLMSAGLYSKSSSQILLSRDGHGRTLGMMWICGQDNKSLKIVGMLIHPMFYGAPQNQTAANNVAFIGRSLIQGAENVAKDQEKVELKIISLMSSVAFFQKNGFVLKDDITCEMSKSLESLV